MPAESASLSPARSGQRGQPAKLGETPDIYGKAQVVVVYVEAAEV
jgi:hypothetical protein